MAKNEGKKFESIIKDCVPDYAMIKRLPDPPQSFTQREDTKYSNKNPYDYLCFDGTKGILYCWELKSTAEKYMSYQINKDDDRKAMIQWHQIEGLTKASKYLNVIAGFLLNFRLGNGEQLLYFFNIKDFNRMKNEINKKSFNIMDCVLYGGIKINGEKKRINYRWDLDKFLKSQSSFFM